MFCRGEFIRKDIGFGILSVADDRNQTTVGYGCGCNFGLRSREGGDGGCCRSRCALELSDFPVEVAESRTSREK